MDLKVLGERAFAHDGGVRFDPSRPVAVLLHGAGWDHSVWRHQTRYLAHQGLSVLAPDLPGHGRSEGPVLESIPAMADWVALLVDEVGASTAAVVGHSMGSLIALECASFHPERIDRIALMATSSKMMVHPDLQDAADRADPLAIDLILGWSFTGPARMGGHPAPGTSAAGAARRLLEKSLGVSLGADLRACSQYDGLTRGPAVRCPTLVISGSRDAMTPARAGRELADTIDGSRFELLDGSGHTALFDDPDPIRRLLQAFLIP